MKGLGNAWKKFPAEYLNRCFLFLLRLEKKDSMGQAWLEGITSTGVSPTRAKRSTPGYQDRQGQNTTWLGIHSSSLATPNPSKHLQVVLERTWVFSAGDLTIEWPSHYWKLIAVTQGAVGGCPDSRAPITYTPQPQRNWCLAVTWLQGSFWASMQTPLLWRNDEPIILTVLSAPSHLEVPGPL